jgi:hypothetical protein
MHSLMAGLLATSKFNFCQSEKESRPADVPLKSMHCLGRQLLVFTARNYISQLLEEVKRDTIANSNSTWPTA